MKNKEKKYTREEEEETKMTVNTESRRANRESGKRKKKLNLGITVTNFTSHTSVSGICSKIICFFPASPVTSFDSKGCANRPSVQTASNFPPRDSL